MRLLREEGHDVTVFYANSNIAPRAEYEKRLVELRKYAAAREIPVVEGRYDPAMWERDVASIGEAIKGFSPALAENAPKPQTVSELLDDEHRRDRCRACYRMRLQEAAAFAAENGYDGLATTLAVSPYQFTGVIREEVEQAAAQTGIHAVFEDYRPYYDEATRISRELGMYRQNYCGCRFSVQEGEATRTFIKQQRAAAKAARAQEHADEIATRESDLKKRAAERRSYDEERARRRAILKELRAQGK